MAAWTAPNLQILNSWKYKSLVAHTYFLVLSKSSESITLIPSITLIFPITLNSKMKFELLASVALLSLGDVVRAELQAQEAIPEPQLICGFKIQTSVKAGQPASAARFDKLFLN